MIMRRITRYVDDLVRSRRPRRFQADDEDAALARTAILLRAARPGSGAPRDEFVAALHRRLSGELDAGSSSPAATGPPAVGQSRPPSSGRRVFLRTATVAGGAAVAGAGIDHALTGPAAPGSSRLDPRHGTWQTVATSAQLPDGAVRPFIAGPVIGFVERSGGRLRAVSGVCTHQGCKLALAARPARLVCPCHGASFTLDGAVLSHRLSIPLAPLAHLEVREAGGVIQVFAPAVPPAPPGPPAGSLPR
jgi:cytochrome b6-f complex iron-sulfur subunit